MAELLGYVAPARKSQTSNSAGVISPVLLGKAPKSPSTQEVYTKTGRHSAKAHRILRGNPAKKYHLIRGGTSEGNSCFEVRKKIRRCRLLGLCETKHIGHQMSSTCLRIIRAVSITRQNLLYFEEFHLLTYLFSSSFALVSVIIFILFKRVNAFNTIYQFCFTIFDFIETAKKLVISRVYSLKAKVMFFATPEITENNQLPFVSMF